MIDEQRQMTRQRIGQRIAELRKNIKWKDAEGARRTGMTQQELAERAGILRNNLSRIEAGRWSVGIDILQQIAEAMGCNIDFVKKKG